MEMMLMGIQYYLMAGVIVGTYAMIRFVLLYQKGLKRYEESYPFPLKKNYTMRILFFVALFLGITLTWINFLVKHREFFKKIENSIIKNSLRV